MSQRLETSLELTILKPVEIVFSAVVDPRPFFVGKTSSPLKANSTIHWEFDDFPGEFPIEVQSISPNESIQFVWGEEKSRTTVEFRFQRFEGSATTITVAEKGWEDSATGRLSRLRNTGGWMHMLCSLKAFLEYGVNLRKGSFAHMKGKIPES